MVLIDYWPDSLRRGDTPTPSTPLSARDGDDEVAADGNTGGSDEQQAMEQQLEREMERQELEKWVKRSTRGAVIVMTLFVAWIITFQVNKDHYGSTWFVMDETPAELTGW